MQRCMHTGRPAGKRFMPISMAAVWHGRREAPRRISNRLDCPLLPSKLAKWTWPRMLLSFELSIVSWEFQNLADVEGWATLIRR
jgi:hypothetical protein